jgi:aspartyl-tRNA(Asn)/glutamyl-tRNA(Gln) amidotransferase subunit B
MYRSGKAPVAVVADLGLAAASDDSELSGIVERAIAANPKPAADYRAGKGAALQALMGAVMRETRGRYPADRVREVLQQTLGSDS